MNRFVSFGLLLAVILLVTFVFFKVMAGFFLPLFMAALLVVIFHPLHDWVLRRVGQRPKIAALLTTASILVIVLLPFTLVVIFAAAEGRSVVRNLDPDTIQDKITALRTKLNLDMPAADEFDRIDRVINVIQAQSMLPNVEQQRDQIEYDIAELRGLAIELGQTPD